jgi:hypothetical protein
VCSTSGVALVEYLQFRMMLCCVLFCHFGAFCLPSDVGDGWRELGDPVLRGELTG